MHATFVFSDVRHACECVTSSISLLPNSNFLSLYWRHKNDQLRSRTQLRRIGNVQNIQTFLQESPVKNSNQPFRNSQQKTTACTSILPVYRPTVYTFHVERGGSLVNSSPFVRRVMHGSNPTLAATYRDLGQVLHLQLPVALRRETPTQYPCCVGSASE